ncbi:MAG: replication restart helicase PriA, partial [Alphaproteobacteria bacterium]
MPPRHASSGDLLSPLAEPAERAERVRVLLPLPLRGAYDYRALPGAHLRPGSFVAVPLSGRERRGVVWNGDPGGGDPGVGEEKLKDVIAALDAPPLPDVSRRFVDWVAAYTMSAPGSVLRMCMSVPEALDPPPPQPAYALAGANPEDASVGMTGARMTGARRRVLAVLADGPPRPGPELAREAGVSPSVVKGLADAGLLARVAIAPPTAAGVPDPDYASPILSPDQGAAAAEIVAQVAAGEFAVALLDGVTGSGKTEVYFEAVAEALRRGRQVLVLLPEIALSAQWLKRFRARFGTAPVEWHSDLTRGRRRRTWRAVAEGRVRVVVGARSALFLPFPELGLIVVDEEHDTSFKQEEGVIYHARDMAVVRARLGGIAAILASATPSLESLTNAERGRYRRLHLPERHGGARLPAVTVVDMRGDPPPRGRWLSPPLVAALAETFDKGEQAMLFLNRRGYAPLTLCRHCGTRLHCPNCTAWLVEHRLAGRITCHHCGHNLPIPESCPECGEADALVACGPGVERVAEEAAARFPSARAEIMTSDTIHGPEAASELIRRIEARQIDLLIGTQIVAKGHHFP